MGDRYAQFNEALGNFNLFPLLTAPEIEKFRVPYGQRTLVKLKNAIQAADDAGTDFYRPSRLWQINAASPARAAHARRGPVCGPVFHR